MKLGAPFWVASRVMGGSGAVLPVIRLAIILISEGVF